MTVLVVGGSTLVALGIEGMGLDSCARSGRGPAMEVATRNVKAQVLMRVQLSPYLETVGAIQRDAILPIIAQRQIRIFLRVLITKSKGDVRG